MMIAGPAGIGKSRLLAEAAADAERRGFRVLRARGSDLEAAFAFGVVRQLFEPLVARAAPAGRDRMLAGAARLCEPLFAGRPDPGDPEIGLRRLHGLYWLSANLSADTPLLLALDDLQWADASSLHFVAYLAARLDGLAVAVLAATRTGADAALLDRIEAEVVRPRPLSPAGVEALAHHVFGRVPNAGFVARCHETTGGIPFLALALMQATDEPAIDDVRPETIARWIARRLERLPESATALCRAVAVLGGHTELRTATALAGLAPATALADLDALCAAGILATGGSVQFVHPIVETAVYAFLPGAERDAGHLAAARLLDADDRPAHEVAAHLMRVEPRGDAWIARTLLTAAQDAAARGSPTETAALLRRALREPPPPEERAETRLVLGVAEVRLGEPAGVRAPRDRRRRHRRSAPTRRRRGRARRRAHSRRPHDRGPRDRRARHRSCRDARSRSCARAGIRARSGEQAHRRPSRAGASVEPLRRDRRRYDRGADAAGRDRLAPGDERRAGQRGRRAGGARDRRRGRDDAARQRGATAVLPGRVADRDLRPLRARRERAARRPRCGLRRRLAGTDAGRRALAGSPGALAGPRSRRRSARDDRAGPRHQRGLGRGAGCSALSARAGAGGARSSRRSRIGARPAGTWRAIAGRRDLEPRARGPRHAATGPGARRGRARRSGSGARTRARRPRENPAACPWRSQTALALHALGEPAEAERLALEEVALARAFGAPRALGVALRVAGLVGANVGRLEEAEAVLRGSGADLEHARALVDLGAAVRRSGRAQRRDRRCASASSWPPSAVARRSRPARTRSCWPPAHGRAATASTASTRSRPASAGSPSSPRTGWATSPSRRRCS